MSIKVSRDELYITYPPELHEHPAGVACHDCSVWAKDAQAICPECKQPLGFGGRVPLNWNEGASLLYRPLDGTPLPYSFWGGPMLVHAECFDERMKVITAENEAKTDGTTA